MVNATDRLVQLELPCVMCGVSEKKLAFLIHRWTVLWLVHHLYHHLSLYTCHCWAVVSARAQCGLWTLHTIYLLRRLQVSSPCFLHIKAWNLFKCNWTLCTICDCQKTCTNGDIWCLIPKYALLLSVTQSHHITSVAHLHLIYLLYIQMYQPPIFVHC